MDNMGDEYERHLNINLKNAANNLDYSEIFDKMPSKFSNLALYLL